MPVFISKTSPGPQAEDPAAIATEHSRFAGKRGAPPCADRGPDVAIVAIERQRQPVPRPAKSSFPSDPLGLQPSRTDRTSIYGRGRNRVRGTGLF
ncbi:hypothetical protein AJ87_09070 [Rhizobium yanglingense]|nr:hypothetical protein AJ87_09070 [Rhizobium yanglingense]